MNTNDLNTALYEKMAAEQDKYRDWLKSQPPEEILHHTYEYLHKIPEVRPRERQTADLFGKP